MGWVERGWVWETAVVRSFQVPGEAGNAPTLWLPFKSQVKGIKEKLQGVPYSSRIREGERQPHPWGSIWICDSIIATTPLLLWHTQVPPLKQFISHSSGEGLDYLNSIHRRVLSKYWFPEHLFFPLSNIRLVLHRKSWVMGWEAQWNWRFSQLNSFGVLD